MNIQIADITLHIDESLDIENRARIEDEIRAVDGVVSVHAPAERPHLMIAGYNPEKTTSGAILETVTRQGIHAELIGL